MYYQFPIAGDGKVACYTREKAKVKSCSSVQTLVLSIQFTSLQGPRSLPFLESSYVYGDVLKDYFHISLQYELVE